MFKLFLNISFSYESILKNRFNGEISFKTLQTTQRIFTIFLLYPQVIAMVSVCTGLLGEEGRVNIPVDTRL